MAPIFVLAGAPAVGKSTTSRALALRFSKGLYVPVDDIRMMVVSGLMLPGAQWGDELTQQVRLARSSVTHMALTYQAAGFAVVIDDFYDSNFMPDYQTLFERTPVHKVLLFPSQDTAHQRNYERSGESPARHYIDEGIRLVYQALRADVQRLAQTGWSIVDTTLLGVDAAVDAIQRQAALAP